MFSVNVLFINWVLNLILFIKFSEAVYSVQICNLNILKQGHLLFFIP